MKSYVEQVRELDAILQGLKLCVEHNNFHVEIETNSAMTLNLTLHRKLGVHLQCSENHNFARFILRDSFYT